MIYLPLLHVPLPAALLPPAADPAARRPPSLPCPAEVLLEEGAGLPHPSLCHTCPSLPYTTVPSLSHSAAEVLREEGADLPHRTRAGNVELPGAGDS